MFFDGFLSTVIRLAEFPNSEEWIKLFMEQVNVNKNYEEAAKTWEGDFLFVVEPDTELKEPSTYYVDLWRTDL